jgi:hypothetical protein
MSKKTFASVWDALENTAGDTLNRSLVSSAI